MDIQPITPSPFGTIRQLKNGKEYWSARDVLHIPDADRRTYEHHYQNGRRDCNAWAYPIASITTFDQWLWFTYISNEFPSYAKYRAIYLKQCAVKQIAAPKQQQPQQIKAPQQLTLLQEPSAPMCF